MEKTSTRSQTPRKIPVARCPVCRRSIVYSDDGRDRIRVSVAAAPPDYRGRTVMCAKCKTMLVISEKERPLFPEEK